MIVPVILSGGSGTRLWPVSRTFFPKQFINLVNETSLFQDTLLRLSKEFSDPLVICNEEHRFIVAEQLRQLNNPNNGIILDPIGKNTAPAIALAALQLQSVYKDPVLLVLSADHLIKDNSEFKKSIKLAEQLAHQDKLVTLGIKPSRAETGYGYIKVNNEIQREYYDITKFIEKPNLAMAQNYFKSGDYFWNSGIFIFKASIYLKELEKFEPKIYSICKKSFSKVSFDDDFIRIDNNQFLNCENKSVDYAVMEKTQDASIVPLEAGWSDVGSWDSLWNSKQKDHDNNIKEGDVILNGVNNSYVHSANRLVAVNNVSDLVIVDTQDALLISDRKNSQNIKEIVEIIKNNKRSESDHHRKVYRPWGYFDSIDHGQGFKVNRICVNAGAKLSLQKHQKRAEHWIVVSGKAMVTCGEKTFELIENQSTYIPIGEIHRLENKEKKPLEIIEIQTGIYLEEDDIIRLDDIYSRI